MTEITKCLNEWNATIEALGCGKQSILIRKYSTTLNEFLLYPTVSYANKDNYLDSFKNEDIDFVKENTLPKSVDKKYEVKYYAKVEEIIEKSVNRIGSLNKYHIWTRDLVSSYLNGNKAKVWLLRVYKLDKPILTKRSNGMVFANTNKKISLSNMKPVISDVEFNKIKEDIIG